MRTRIQEIAHKRAMERMQEATAQQGGREGEIRQEKGAQVMNGPYGIRACNESTNLSQFVAVDLALEEAVRIIEAIEEVLHLACVHEGFVVGIERVEEREYPEKESK